MRNNSGFTLVEILISLVMVVAAFGMLSHFGTVNEQRIKQASVETCEQTAKNIISDLRSIGYTAANATLDRSNYTLTYDATEQKKITSVKTITGIQVSDIIPDGAQGAQYINVSGVRQNYYIVAGTMTFLSNLYNRNRATFCGVNGGVFNRFNGIEEIPNQFSSVETRIRIERQPLYSASTSRDCDPFIPAPGGERLNPVIRNHGAGTVADVRYDSGFWVTVTVAYNNANGERKNCSASGLFKYPAIARNPTMDALPTVTIIPVGSQGQCGTPRTNGRLTVQLTGTGNPLKEGWVPMCRDDSSPVASMYRSNPAYCNGRDSEPVSVNTNWVPCERVTLCGRSGVASWNSDQTLLTVNYTNIPYGCNAAIATYVFDMAGNSTSPTSPQQDSDRQATPNLCFASCPSGYLAGNYCTTPNNLSSACTPEPPPSGDGSRDGGSHDGNDSGDGASDGANSR